jgi:hypothetical protein
VSADDVYAIAPEPLRWICAACGKRSRNRAGFDPETRKSVAGAGWDESCMMSAVLCRPATNREKLDTGCNWMAVEHEQGGEHG